MDRELFWNRKLENFFHSAALLGAMGLLLALLLHMVFGGLGIVMALFVSLATLTLGSGISTRWIMRLHRARPLTHHEAPTLLATAGDLAARAGLTSLPRLYYVPSAQLNAFAVGDASDPAIGVTDGLLRRLNSREMAGVLAHEISHIKNHDLRILGLATVLTRMTRTLSFLGPVLLVLSLPLALFGQVGVPWLAIWVLMLAPTLSALLQLALSRTREFEADLDAARLTGDPDALASALAKLEAPSGNWLMRLFTEARRQPAEESELLRSHPTTEERIRRLRSLSTAPSAVHRPPQAPFPVRRRVHAPVHRAPVSRAPVRRVPVRRVPVRRVPVRRVYPGGWSFI